MPSMRQNFENSSISYSTMSLFGSVILDDWTQIDNSESGLSIIVFNIFSDTTIGRSPFFRALLLNISAIFELITALKP